MHHYRTTADDELAAEAPAPDSHLWAGIANSILIMTLVYLAAGRLIALALA